MNKRINENDFTIKPQDKIKIHITYNELLTLKELSEIIDVINKSANDVNRENGVTSNAKLGKEYASRVSGVESGSIVLDILTNFAVPVTVSVLSNYIYERMKLYCKKKNHYVRDDAEQEISIDVHGNENIIEIHIDKAA